MSDLSPLLSGEPNELESRLLLSAEEDEPGTLALEKVGRALGVSAAALAAASAGSALVGQAAVAGNAVALSKPLTLVSLTKWLAVGITAGLTTGGVAHVVSRATTPPQATFIAPVARPSPEPVVAQAPPSRQAPVAAAEPAPEPPPAGTVSPASTAAFAPLPAAGAPREPAPLAASANTGSASFEPLAAERAAVPGEQASTLGDETKALDGARQALAGGRAAAALGALDAYRAKWPRGALRAEAALLRVDTLLRLGQRTAAEREANALIAQAPGSHYATRARALLGAPHQN